MGIKNTKTGFYGFTIDTTGNLSDSNGDTNKCIFALTYPLQASDVNLTISRGHEDWAAQMGDGSIIPIRDPEILFVNKDNSIVLFTMDKKYPANSPCFLMYRSDTASWGITARSDVRPFEMNSICGYFAFTIDDNTGANLEYGYTKTLQATIPFPNQSTDVVFTISNDPNHWGVRMGDGSIITLRNATVMFTNRDNAVIRFTMDTAYPSNSPGVLVYRSDKAVLNVEPQSGEAAFIPVTDIIGLPDNIVTNVPFVLEEMTVLPYNATVQSTVWEVVSGNAVIENNKLIATSTGVVVLKCTIPKALGPDKSYFKNFNVRAVENEIQIISQPVPNINLTLNKAGDILAVNATSTTTKIMQYQWYRNSTKSTENGTELTGETSSSFNVPYNRIGHFYYYCKVSAAGARDVFSDICDVYVSAELGSIFISNAPEKLYIDSTYKLEIGKDAAAADLPKVVWNSSNSYVASINKDTGVISVINEGSVTFTATTIDGKLSASCTVVVPRYVSVTNVSGISTTIDTDTNILLNGIVEPSDASVKTIEWSILDARGTGAYINNGYLRARVAGTCLIRATVRKGISPSQDYTRDFWIDVKTKFVPVEGVTLQIDSTIIAKEVILLTANVTPENATYRNVSYSIADAGTTGARLNGDLLSTTGAGTLKIKATIVKGISETVNYERTFTINVGSEWISVESITNMPENFDPVDEPLNLTGTVYPSNATMKNIIYKIKSAPAAARVSLNLQNQLVIDYENVTWWNRNPSPTPPDYFDQWLKNINDPIVVEMTVVDGVRRGVNFVATASITIVPPASPDIFVAVEGIRMNLPSIIRAKRPIPMLCFGTDPFNATGQSIEVSPIRPNDPEFKGGLCTAFRPRTESQNYWETNYNIEFNPDYDWNMDCYYLYNYEDGVTKFVFAVPNGIEKVTPETNSTWEHSYYVTFLPEYMEVANIVNIPETVYVNGTDNSYVLDPKCHTNKVIGNRQSNTYDEEVPSYTDVRWSLIDSGGTTGTSITNDGTLTIGNEDVGKKIKIRAEVPQGKHEAYEWYKDAKENDPEKIVFQAESYYQDFEITIAEDPNKTKATDDDPLAKVKLASGETVIIKWMSQLSRLCNHRVANSNINIAGKVFKKSDITEVEFWKADTGLTVPTSLRSFGCNFINLVKVNRIPNVTGDRCLMEFLEGCTKFNQALTIPAGVTGEECLHGFLKNCTAFNSAVTIPAGVTGKGAMKRFLSGCTKFNQAITIPASLTGEQCLMRFLEYCSTFNQALTIPAGVTGARCLDHFLFRCISFNKALTLPNALAGTANMRGFMRDTWNMISTITVSAAAAEGMEINGLTFGCFERSKTTFSTGITIAGDGATKFKEKCPNSTDTLPIRKFK